jgi:hypothetical protein
MVRIILIRGNMLFGVRRQMYTNEQMEEIRKFIEEWILPLPPSELKDEILESFNNIGDRNVEPE